MPVEKVTKLYSIGILMKESNNMGYQGKFSTCVSEMYMGTIYNGMH